MAQRHGGDHRGSAASRRARRAWLRARYDTCVHCGRALTWDDPLADSACEADRKIPGGPYARWNIQAACRLCNRARSCHATMGGLPA